MEPSTLRLRRALLLSLPALLLLLLIASPLHIAASVAPVTGTAASAAAQSASPAATPVLPGNSVPAGVAPSDSATAAHLDPDEFDTAEWAELDSDTPVAPVASETTQPEPADAPDSESTQSHASIAVLQSGFLGAAMSMLSDWTMPSPGAGASAAGRKGARDSGAFGGLLSSPPNWPLLAAGAVLTLGAAALLWACLSPGRGRASSKKRTPRQIPPHLQPLLVELRNNKVGRVQGLDWAAKNLKTDADGDEAHEFLGPF